MNEEQKNDLALLTPEEMGLADRAAIEGGVPGIDLMRRAGEAVGRAALSMCRSDGRVLVLCGPGNNGGDGFVAAEFLRREAVDVEVLLLKDPGGLTGDAALAFREMQVPASVADLDEFGRRLENTDLVIDALFGAGLDRPLKGRAAELVEAVNRSGVPVLSVDLPSGLNGATGEVAGGEAAVGVVRALRSVTFFRLKPGHLLFPGRELCGAVDCVEIGIPAKVLDAIAPLTFLNRPALWHEAWPVPGVAGHKYDRGHAVVFSGSAHATGAARLAAGAALRAGAGLVTLASPPSAVLVNAAHLTAVMLRSVKDEDAIAEMLSDRRLNAVLIGPGFGVGEHTQAGVRAVLKSQASVVLDADALTSFQAESIDLFGALDRRDEACVLTPHDGEFKRLFPDLADLPKLERARAAAKRSGAVVLLKGPDTVVAEPGGRASINRNAPPWLATAGSGDVLAGIVTGLLAQGMPAFEAASMAVWMHGAAGGEAGPGLTAEDLAPALRLVIAGLVEKASGAN
ncbi:NAD(P)H-hydrate dehydratase [Roseibium sp.]|uniref:NAD(P)H-hydrate dehydratase n=1 Tax=Roseibium sp. TaxID=1936156 RepID=UPI003A986557